MPEMPFFKTSVLLLGLVHFFFYPEYCENFGFIQMDSLTLSGYKMDFPKAVHDWFSFDFS